MGVPLGYGQMKPVTYQKGMTQGQQPMQPAQMQQKPMQNPQMQRPMQQPLGPRTRPAMQGQPITMSNAQAGAQQPFQSRPMQQPTMSNQKPPLSQGLNMLKSGDKLGAWNSLQASLGKPPVSSLPPTMANQQAGNPATTPQQGQPIANQQPQQPANQPAANQGQQPSQQTTAVPISQEEDISKIDVNSPQAHQLEANGTLPSQYLMETGGNYVGKAQPDISNIGLIEKKLGPEGMAGITNTDALKQALIKQGGNTPWIQQNADRLVKDQINSAQIQLQRLNTPEGLAAREFIKSGGQMNDALNERGQPTANLQQWMQANQDKVSQFKEKAKEWFSSHDTISDPANSSYTAGKKSSKITMSQAQGQ